MSQNQQEYLFKRYRRVSNSSFKGTGSDSSLNVLDGSLRIPWKFVVLGDAGVGKSSVVKQFLKLGFSSVYNPTVEDNYIHNIALPGYKSCLVLNSK